LCVKFQRKILYTYYDITCLYACINFNGAKEHAINVNYDKFITYAKEVMFLPDFVCLSVC